MITRGSPINPDDLPEMNVIHKVDSESIIARRMTNFMRLWRESDPDNAFQYDVDMLETDPIKINQVNNAHFQSLHEDRVNQAARAVTLAWAVGTDLDGIATRYPMKPTRLPGEEDERFRRRIWLSGYGLSVAGSGEGYEFWTLSTAPTVRDAAAWSPQPGHVQISILGPYQAPRVPDATLMDIRTELMLPGLKLGPMMGVGGTGSNLIAAMLQAKKPLTDILSVTRASLIEPTIRVKAWLRPGADRGTVLGSMQTAADRYIQDAYYLGRDVTPGEIDAMLWRKGVARLRIDEPTEDLLIGPNTAVRIKSAEIAFGGWSE